MQNYILLFLVSSLPLCIMAQNGNLEQHHRDSLHLEEQLLLQQQQQRRIDSLIGVKLKREISALSEDNKQRRILESQLAEVGRRDSISKEEQRRKAALLKRTAEGYPVVLLQDTLFYVFSRLGSFSATERASAISARLQKLYDDDFFQPDSLKLIKGEGFFDIVYNKDLVVTSISELDALYFNKNPEQLGREYLSLIKTTIIKRKETNSLKNWLRRLGMVALVITGILGVVWVINKLFKLISRALISRKETYFKGLHIKDYKLFSQKEHLRFWVRLLRVLRVATIVLALYLSLPILFSIFPQTRDYTYTLLNWIISPAKSVIKGVVSYLPNLFTIVVIYFFTKYTVRAVKFAATEIEAGKLKITGFYSDWAKPTYSIVKFLLYAFMLVVIFPYLPGSNSPIFQGVSVFLGILFSLGSSTAIANVVAGLVITYMRPFKVGDRVKIGEITGDVLEKTMLVTRMRTVKNEEITVPNATILSSHTINYTTAAEKNGLIVHTTITLGYDVPWAKVHDALVTAALRTNLVEQQPKPFVLQTSLEDFYVAYQINAYTFAPSSQAKIYSDLHQHIQDCCNEAGIEILSPHYQALRDGNMTTIPENYLNENYKAPAFRVSDPGQS